METAVTTISLKISECSSLLIPKDRTFEPSFALGTCKIELSESETIGFEFKAKYSPEIEDGYKDLGHKTKQISCSVQAKLETSLQEPSKLNLFQTYDLYITEKANSYTQGYGNPDPVDINISKELIGDLRVQAARYHTAREDYGEATNRILEIVERSFVNDHRVEGLQILNYLGDCLRARGWDSGVSNSNYQSSKLSRARRCFEDLARRKSTSHPGYIDMQREFRRAISAFGEGVYGAPESWKEEPPRAHYKR